MPNGLTRFDPPPVGQHGNYYKHELYDNSIGGKASGYTLDLGELQKGTRLLDFDLIHDNLGAGTTLSIGYRYKNSAYGAAAPTAFRNAQASTANTNVSAKIKPITFEHDVIITATLGGATAAAGTPDLYFLPGYIFKEV